MLSYQVYKVLHIVGLAMIFISYGALLLKLMTNPERQFQHRRMVMVTHGVGMVLALVAGFGLMARIGIQGSWPIWVWLKLGVWLLLGVGVAIVLRTPKLAQWNWWILIFIAGLATYIANYKPSL